MNKLTEEEIKFINGIHQFGAYVDVPESDLSSCDSKSIAQLHAMLNDSFNPSIDKANPTYQSIMNKVNNEMNAPRVQTTMHSKMPSASQMAVKSFKMKW
ncbi:MAG: hypothetical protein MJ245_04410 [Clostridia bacterium]|nr:hypothetical protein [Clostridia bacterium]